MIQIQITTDIFDNPKLIQVEGHANYAPHGQDIICASVSVLLQTVGYALAEREDTFTMVNFEQSGFGIVSIENPTRESYLIAEVFVKGAAMLAEQYPEHVTLEMM